MIKPIEINDKGLMEFLYLDPIINYFILIGIDMNKYQKVFEKAWGDFNEDGELRAVLLKRRTGNVQFFVYGKYDCKGISEVLKKEGFLKLIGEEKIIAPLREYIEFSKCEGGAHISRLREKPDYGGIDKTLRFKVLEGSDTDRVIELYKRVFKSFAPERIMREKLLNGSGRGYYLEENGQIVSIAQSAYEHDGSAVIVGVATHPDYRGKGLASRCLMRLCCELVDEGRELALQYDNQEAGRIYRRLGFIETDRMINCEP